MISYLGKCCLFSFSLGDLWKCYCDLSEFSLVSQVDYTKLQYFYFLLLFISADTYFCERAMGLGNAGAIVIQNI